MRQPGVSDARHRLAAELIFATGGKLADAQRYYADVRGRAKGVGRDPDHTKILVAVSMLNKQAICELSNSAAILPFLVYVASPQGRPKFHPDFLQFNGRNLAEQIFSAIIYTSFFLKPIRSKSVSKIWRLKSMGKNPNRAFPTRI
jgi:hypothetical protein